MAVIAHAQHQYIDWRQLGQCLVGGKRCRGEVGGRPIQTDKPSRHSRSPQQMAAYQPFVAVGMGDRHPALIRQADHYLRPGQRLLRQALEESDGAASAGHHQGRRTVAIDSRAQRPGDRIGQGIGQLRRIAQAARDNAKRQIKLRDRHTRTSRRE
ncbi:hypothetical protein D9M68_794490 [compost metagenome]